MRQYIGKNVKIHPEGDFNKFVIGRFERREMGAGLKPGYYLGLMQVPSTRILSVASREEILDIELEAEYFELNRHLAIPS